MMSVADARIKAVYNWMEKFFARKNIPSVASLPTDKIVTHNYVLYARERERQTPTEIKGKELESKQRPS